MDATDKQIEGTSQEIDAIIQEKIDAVEKHMTWISSELRQAVQAAESAKLTRRQFDDTVSRLKKNAEELAKEERQLRAEQFRLRSEKHSLLSQQILLAKEKTEVGAAASDARWTPLPAGASALEPLDQPWHDFCSVLPSALFTPAPSTAFVETAGRLSLPPAVHWGGNPSYGSNLVVRSCFEPLLERIHMVWKEHQIPNIVLGTPGTGKSMYRFFVLWRLVRDFAEGKIEGDTLIVAWQEAVDSGATPECSVRLFRWTRSAQDSAGLVFEGNLFRSGSAWHTVPSYASQHPKGFYIVDGMSPFSVIGRSRWRILEVSKPRLPCWMRNVSNSRHVYSYMPTWTMEELSSLASVVRPQMTEVELEKRFEFIGGVVCAVMEDEASKEPHEYVEQALFRHSPTELWEMEEANTEENSISYRLIHMLVDEEGEECTTDMVARGPYARYNSCYASTKVGDLVYRKIMTVHAADFRDLFSGRKRL